MAEETKGMFGREKFKWNVVLFNGDTGETHETEYENYWSPNRTMSDGSPLVTSDFVANSCAAEFRVALKQDIRGVSAVIA